MSFAVRVDEPYAWVVGRHVSEGQSVAPGAPLVDVMTPEGVVQTIVSQGWGIVAHVEGNKLAPVNDRHGEDSSDEDDAGDEEKGGGSSSSSGGGMFRFNFFMADVYGQDEIICHVVARSNEGGTRKTGLHPRASGAVKFRLLHGLPPR